MPPFASAGLISAGGGVVVLYGVSYPDNVADPNRIAAYHASEDVWKVSPKAPFSTSHRGRTEVLVLSMDEVLFNGSHVYRVRANKWEKFTRKWFTISRARYFRNGSNLYAIGMTDSLDGGVQVLDLNSWKFSPPKTIHGVLGHNVMVLDDNSLLIFGGSHGDTIIGDRDGKRGWLERVLHMSPKADKVHQIYELPKEQAMSSFIPIGDNRAVLLGADCTTSFLLSYAQGRLSVNQRPAATFLLSNEQQWIEEWLFKCESPAEEAFLVEAIKQFDLQPVGSRLEGECVLEMQVKIDRSRVDFLFDGSVIVEVDGHQFHSGVEESKRDAARDSVLRAKGFRLLRITAHRIFHAPEAAVADVRDMLR